jgi:hypothetical protein
LVVGWRVRFQTRNALLQLDHIGKARDAIKHLGMTLSGNAIRFIEALIDAFAHFVELLVDAFKPLV